MTFTCRLACAAACVLVAGCDRQRAEDPPPAAAGDGGPLEITAASFNLRYENSGDPGSRSWRHRLVPVVRMVRRMNPDVMGVQEALHGQTADLWASLPDYGFYGVGRDDGKRAGEYSGIFYRRDRFTADPADRGTFWLSDRPDEPGSRTWGNVIPRVALWIYLTDNKTGRGIYVFNTHWDHQHQGSRERAAVLLAARIDARRHPAAPVVLLGDFNANESNPAVAWLHGAAARLPGARATWPGALTDTYQAIHPGEENRRTLHFWGASPKGTLKVDHILVSKGTRILTANIHRDHTPMPSDHFPVSATVRWP
jgi:endonuclease/exonuclease/phosphatase family metal-dependent hydrolase